MKKIFAIVMILVVLLVLTACGNKRGFIASCGFKYTRAQIRMLDGGVVHGDVKDWAKSSDGTIQVTLMDGRKYLTHANNVILRSE